ncbi:FAD-binding oxidoreductase [candidate division CSSED10-310 bacterium]|uniref:FAD-binding oxidoreductase n=1 Tax=candidate division CSSED10-310 bacterium TaxID=2855610 RepID=A0ABV6Z4Y6_UNCC1
MKTLKDTYRSILKWGDVEHEETIDETMLNLLQKTFALSAAQFTEPYLPGNSPVKVDESPKLSSADIEALQHLVGPENVNSDDYSRAYHAYGKTYLDLIKLRLEIVDNPPDVVVYPRNEADIVAIVTWADQNKISLTPFGGHSSVTRGLECPRGGISLDLTRHLNQVLSVNRINSSVTVQAGMYGPAFEKYLNNYKDGYTCGHFPQSFEFSTVGGWVVTRGAGQQSTSYGKIEDMVLSIRLVSPVGIVETRDYPAASIGPDIGHLIMGSEGTYGIITAVTLKIRKYAPDQNRYFSFICKDFESAVRIMRETMQGQFGFPSMFRLSDHEETDFAFKLKGAEGSMSDHFLKLLGYQPLKRCLLYVSTVGDPDHGKLIQKKISRLARKNGAFPLGATPALKWLEQRFSSAYLRDPLMDAGIMVDTLETAATWENLPKVWQNVRAVIKARESAVAMVHISHVYENGANLYFVFMTPMVKGKEIADYCQYQNDIITAIHENGGSLSHHHGIGRMLGPWMEKEIGETGLNILKMLKKHFDPNQIMNPGGTLGLD